MASCGAVHLGIFEVVGKVSDKVWQLAKCSVAESVDKLELFEAYLLDACSAASMGDETVELLVS